jgi:hypothetical protein
MEYAIQMASGSMIYISIFINTGSGIRKLIGGNTQTHRQDGDLISLLLFFQSMERRLKMLVWAHGLPAENRTLYLPRVTLLDHNIRFSVHFFYKYFLSCTGYIASHLRVIVNDEVQNDSSQVYFGGGGGGGGPPQIWF